jgi:hypothetical protein
MASRAREFENLEFVENNYADEDQEMETNVDPANNDEDNNINKEDWLNNVYEYCNCKIRNNSLFHFLYTN